MNRKRIVHTLLLSLVTLAVITCVSDADDMGRNPRSYPRDGGGARAGSFARAGGGTGDGLDTMPAGDWWRDPQISAAVALSADQIASLDRINHEQGEEIAKLDRDSMVAARELRETFDASQPDAAGITAAGQRLRGIRDALFDRRVQLFASERVLLTQTQWQALQQALAARNRPDRDNRGNTGRGGRGGRGGMGGRGRFPG
ncbi:MAG: hypothetical protein QOK37_1297 [Thermoanaerobaculia bacterium]|jgi:hypothetical protein|nr:hypothetical protein [Thermoanaerobaculia bacterium]